MSVMNCEIVTHINDKPIYRRSVGILPANKALVSRAKALRKAGVLSEVLFWQQVRNNTFWSIDFDRQRVIGSFIVDFYVKSLGLAIEIDGSSHDGKEEYEGERQKLFEDLGLKVYRVTDSRIKHNLYTAMAELEDYIIAEFGNLPAK